jgi:hypothetical protein
MSVVSLTLILKTEIPAGIDKNWLLLPDGFSLPLPPRLMWRGHANCTVERLDLSNRRPAAPADARAYIVTLTRRGHKWGDIAKQRGVKEVLKRGTAMSLEAAGIEAATLISGALVGFLWALKPARTASEQVWRMKILPHSQVEVWMIGFD